MIKTEAVGSGLGAASGPAPAAISLLAVGGLLLGVGFRYGTTGAVLDRARRRVVLMASAEGGIEIEQVAAETPEKIVTVAAHPFLGLRDFQARILADGIGIPREHTNEFIRIAKALYQTYLDTDASLAEINPLVTTPAGGTSPMRDPGG